MQALTELGAELTGGARFRLLLVTLMFSCFGYMCGKKAPQDEYCGCKTSVRFALVVGKAGQIP